MELNLILTGHEAVVLTFTLFRLLKFNTIFETIRTKRLELLRNYFHSCLRGDCLPISTCSFLTHIMGMSITIIAWMRMLLHEWDMNETWMRHEWDMNETWMRHEWDMNEREINYLILFNTLFYYYTLSYSLIPILHY